MIFTKLISLTSFSGYADVSEKDENLHKTFPLMIYINNSITGEICITMMFIILIRKNVESEFVSLW